MKKIHGYIGILDFNEMTGEKARWEIQKNVACYFEQILEAEPYKTATTRTLTSRLTYHPSQRNKKCWTVLKKYKLISDIILCVSTYGHTSENLHSSALCRHKVMSRQLDQKQWLRGIDGKRVKGISAISLHDEMIILEFLWIDFLKKKKNFQWERERKTIQEKSDV